MNKHDLLNICILAIDGYGENADTSVLQNVHENTNANTNDETHNPEKATVSYRGDREWRDTVGGATLTCSQCCATLGFASVVEPDSCRLLKHKLQAFSMDNGKRKDHFEHLSSGSFVGKEIVRYSESQAVFTFAVYDHPNESVPNEKAERCLLIKVLSWSSLMAIKASAGDLCFRRAVKVIYEEQDAALMRSTNDADADRDASDPALFQWGGIDLCCPPNMQKPSKVEDQPILEGNDDNSLLKSSTKASVNIYLAHDEWDELRDILQCQSKYFSEATSRATVMMKFGVGGESQANKARLSFLSF